MIELAPVSGGVVHALPEDLRVALTRHRQALATWGDITPLARNEWICWIESAKKSETRAKRIIWGVRTLTMGNGGRVVGEDALTGSRSTLA